MRPHDLVVVGAGPGGLCAAAAARNRGWNAPLIERSDRIGGIWSQVPLDMRCLSPRHRDVMPDRSFPQGPGPRARASEVLEALERYAEAAAFDVRLGVSVTWMGPGPEGLLRLETTGGPVHTRRAVLATGEYGCPATLELPGRFDGPVQWARDLRLDEVRPGEHVVVVGTGNTAEDLVPRLLAAGAEVTVAARSAVSQPAAPMGPAVAALRWWASGLPVGALPRRLRCTGTVPAQDHNIHSAASSGRLRVVGPAAGYEPGGLRTGRGEFVDAERIVLATGYRRELGFASTLQLDPATGVPSHRRGISTDLPGVGFMGLPCMRTRRSGFLRGFVADARAVVALL